MSWNHLTEEQKLESARKGAETRRKNREAAKAAGLPHPELVAEELEMVPQPEDDYSELLSPEEIEEIRVAERAKYRAEQKAKAKKALVDKIRTEERDRLGSTPADELQLRWLNELVPITITMPRLRRPNGAEQPPEPIILDQRIFNHGRTVMVTRAQALTLAEVMGKAWMHVAQVDGRTRTYYNEQTGQMMYQGGYARGGGNPGMSFDALHRRPA